MGVRWDCDQGGLSNLGKGLVVGVGGRAGAGVFKRSYVGVNEVRALRKVMLQRLI
jgi:hypothetical protein